jgi:Heparinase II/III-like protein
MSNDKKNIPVLFGFIAAIFLLWPISGCTVKDEHPAFKRLQEVRHPTVYITPADIERGRQNAARFPWAKAIADRILSVAKEWAAKDDAWILAQVPGKGACFAYGFTGCPICGAGWGIWDKARASFDNPGHVTCDNGHVLPDAAHPDPGTGWVAPDGRIHYFVGSYNAWVIEKLTLTAVENLAYAYSLTGDERCAAKAALILDAVAAIYPSCDKGSWDYPSNPPSGRLDRPWYQVSRVLVRLIDHYDQIYNSVSLDGPSATPGLTKRQNIETNMLRNAAAYCFEQSQAGGLNNGEADYIRGTLAAGICLDIPEYIRWAVDGPFGIFSLLENNISRDGQYFETSPLYSDHARNLYVTYAEPLLNCRREPYPNGLDLYGHPKMRSLLTLLNLSIAGAGHLPPFGDTMPDISRLEPKPRPENASDLMAAERLYERTPEGAGKARAASLRYYLADRALGGAKGEPGDPYWLLFHQTVPPPQVPPLPAEIERRLTGTHFLGQKGIGLLRTGGHAEQALLLRFGPSLNHGHFDDLGYNLFALGYELTYDLGYEYANTHTQVGLAKQTASHNLVVVDETSQQGLTGGSLLLLADFPDVKVIEASSEDSYAGKGVALYRRTMALVGEGPGAYLVDLFRVRGGSRHDYFTHFRGKLSNVGGVTLDLPEPGSLAGSGFTWGSRQLNDGDIEGHPNSPYWNPPPGNGYGFFVHPRRGRMTGAVRAEWEADKDAKVRFIMAPEPGTEIVIADAPGIKPNFPRAEYVIARRQGRDLASSFASVVEAFGQIASVQSIEDVPLAGAGDGIAARGLVISRTDGTKDYFYSALDERTRSGAGLSLGAKFGFARVKDGTLAALYLIGGREFRGFGWTVSPEMTGWEGTVEGLDVGGSALTTTADLPDDGRLDGALIRFSNPGYSRTTAYRIAKVVKEDGRTKVILDEPIVLGKGEASEVKGPHTLISRIPHEYARSVYRQESGFFRGKLIKSASGAETKIIHATPGKTLELEVEDVSAFKPGEIFHYIDIQKGDNFRIDAVGRLERLPDGYRYAGTAAADIQTPAGARLLPTEDR